MFTFGIGSGASTALVKGLAKTGNGTAEFIKEGERLQPKVLLYVNQDVYCTAPNKLAVFYVRVHAFLIIRLFLV